MQLTKDNLKIVFFGTPDFAVPSLDRLVNEGYNIAAVVTAPDKPAGRGHHMLQSAVKEYAVAHNLDLLQPTSLKDPQFVEDLRSIGADLFIVIAFRMLPEIVWQMPHLGTFNLHGSLLPKYRGAAPINWAIINGETQTGVTTFFLKHEIDTGDIIDRRAITIGPNDCLGDIYDQLMMIGSELTASTVARIIDGTLTTTPQDTAGLDAPSPAPKIFTETCHIDWTQNAQTVHNLVRGLSPYPGAWTELQSEDQPALKFKILQTLVADKRNLEPGQIEECKEHLYVGCGNGSAVEVLSLQPQGKRRMPAADFLRGNRSALKRFE